MAASPLPLLHKYAAPVSIAEFADVLRQLCKPRFPNLRPHSGHKIGGGGLDSMALAVLFSQFLKRYPHVYIGDAHISGINAFIINHSLRQGSLQEATDVAAQVQNIPGVHPVVASIDWTQYGHTNPKSQSVSMPESQDFSKISSAAFASNIETLARRARYQLLGKLCLKHNSDSLFFAHHRSDVYETILLRLLSGASRRGLSGIRPRGDIPECYGMFGVHRSGLIKALSNGQSYLGVDTSQLDVSSVGNELRSGIYDDIKSLRGKQAKQDNHTSTYGSWYLKTVSRAQQQGETPFGPCILPARKETTQNSASPADVVLEDGGVHIYRPLLPFDKDRLRATCIEYGIHWVEDKTNADPTVTKRNAIRYMATHYKLPRALQKDTILHLADRCTELNQQDASTANWLLSRTELKLDPQVGTLKVSFPNVAVSLRDRLQRRRQIMVNPKARNSQWLRRKLKIKRLRLPAAILVQKLIHTISPRKHFPDLVDIDPFISRLFPDLSPTQSFPPAKSFCLGGVLFTPLPGPPHAHWLVSRQPYVSLQPPPRVSFPTANIPTAHPDSPYIKTQPMSSWHPTHLWDGRYWICLRHRLPGHIVVAPLTPAHLSTLRNRLSRKLRQALDAVLRACAPGKVRFTLPALYYSEAVCGPAGTFSCNSNHGAVGGGDTDDHVKHLPGMQILALPTLGYVLPEAGGLVEWQVSYKMVDNDVKSQAISLSKNRR
ncbi:hypothetical protein Cpir12675_002995 [Ceratocystis pirilliformis]|uniref:tRNA(Ile)-lysidine synthetase n=1 Tax=Ceratocystis pirilliformis TaxID=259994 RepID=A0ABR3Z5W2_9PEZI